MRELRQNAMFIQLVLLVEDWQVAIGRKRQIYNIYTNPIFGVIKPPSLPIYQLPINTKIKWIELQHDEIVSYISTYINLPVTIYILSRTTMNLLLNVLQFFHDLFTWISRKKRETLRWMF